MGDTQSAYEDDEPGQDAAACRVDCGDDERHKDDVAGKSDAPLNGVCEDDISPQGGEISEKSPQEVEALLRNVLVNQESVKETEEEISLDVTQVEAKHNDVNDGFKTFFSKVGVKFTLKPGSRDHGEIGKQDPESTEVKDPADRIHDDRTQVDLPPEGQNNESTCPNRVETGVREDSQNKEDSPDNEWTHLDMSSEQEPSSLSDAKEDVTMSPIKKFFTTGIFAGLQKKSISLEDEVMTRELLVQEVEETAKEMTRDQEEDTDNSAVTVADDDQNENPPANVVNESESPKEVEAVPSSPLKRLLLGSSLMKVKRQKDTKQSEGEDCKPSSDSHHLSSPTDTTENDKKESPAETTGAEEESPWATFKKLLSPKRRVNRSALSNDDTQTPVPKDKSELNQGDEILEHTVDEGKKRKDSAISWDALLCGTSHTASDSDHEKPSENVQPPQNLDKNAELLAATTKGVGSPAEGDVESTWNAFKRLMSPKKKAKPEEERQQSLETDDVQENFSFSAKIFPTWKKRKSLSKKDHEAPPCEVDQELLPDDLNSPAVFLSSNSDTVTKDPKEDTEASVKTDFQLNQDFLPEAIEAAQPLDELQIQDTQRDVDALQNEATYEDLADLTEFIGKPLSDILEEGDFTESATANEPVEVTSEAVTADASLGDDSELISALSHLADATTRVGAEFHVKKTEEFLQQVVESISTNRETDLLCLDKIVCSALSDTLQTFGEFSQLREVQKLDLTPTRTDVVVNEMEAAMDTTETTELTPPTPTKELDTQRTTTQISTEELDTREITSSTPREEFEPQEITPQIPLENSGTKEISPQMAPEELDKEITTFIPTRELDAQKMATPIPTDKLDAEEIKATSTEERDTQEITPHIPTVALVSHKITTPIPAGNLDDVETMEITAPIPDEQIGSKEITTLIPDKELDTQEITLPIPAEKIDTQEITTSISDEKLDTEELKPSTCTKEHDTEEITTVIPTKELDTPGKELDPQEIMTPNPPERLETEEIKPIFPEQHDTEEITTVILTKEIGTRENMTAIPPENLHAKEIRPDSNEEHDVEQELTPRSPTMDRDTMDTEELKPATCTEDHDIEEITPQTLTEELDTREIASPIPTKDHDTDEIATVIPTKELDTQEISPPTPGKELDAQEITTPNPPERLDTEEITTVILTKEIDTQENMTAIPPENLYAKEIRPDSNEEHDIEQEITPRSPTMDRDTMDTEELKPATCTEEHDVEETTPQTLTEELDTREIASPIPTKDHDTDEIATVIPTKELDTQEISPPTPGKELDAQEIRTPNPPERLDTEEITTVILTKEIDTQENMTAIPPENLYAKEIRPDSNEEHDIEQEITPRSPTMDRDTMDTEELKPATCTEEHDVEETTPQTLTEELDTREIASPIPTKDHDTDEIATVIPTKELDTQEISPPTPGKELDAQEITTPNPPESLDTEEITTVILTKEIDTQENMSPIPPENLHAKEIRPDSNEEHDIEQEITPRIPTIDRDTRDIEELKPATCTEEHDS
ncbi:A-kinase anchor protein 12 [Syngnathoides biaculeatus]|uniref:A-kinase anchor protein 12 n=1 Tax=Syngnathoides biaculeatus TaxID=300417 RepID=UPI002ADE3BC8|nr:A-kinase anchor protein 12 [Syngnathoides biaculeatus]